MSGAFSALPRGKGLFFPAIRVCIILLLVQFLSFSKILYRVTYETGDFSELTADPYAGVHKSGSKASVTVVANPAPNAGNPSAKCARFSITPADERAEVRQWRAPRLGEYWYGWQMYIPPNWSPIRGKSEIIQQWHRKGGIQGTYVQGHPMVLMVRENGGYSMTYNYSTGTNSRHEGGVSVTGNAKEDAGKWINWAFHVKWAESEGQGGFMKLYHNGTLAMSHTGPNWERVRDAGYPFYMGGIYTGNPGWSGPNPYVIFNDNHFVGDAGASMALVNPYMGGDPGTLPDVDPPDPPPRIDFTVPRVKIAFGGIGEEGWPVGDHFARNGQQYSFAGAVSIDGVTEPAPAGVYSSVVHRGESVEDILISLPDVPNGSYILRFHITDVYGNRAIDILAEGGRVIEDLDPITEAGGILKALVKTAAVDVSDGNGLQLVLTDDRAEPKDVFLGGLEIVRTSVNAIHPLCPARSMHPHRKAAHRGFLLSGRRLPATTASTAGIAVNFIKGPMVLLP